MITGLVPNRKLEISSGAITKLKIPFINDKIKEIADTYLTSDNKFNLKLCELKILSTKAQTFDESNRVVYEKIFNTSELNVVDYIEDKDNDFEKTSQIYI